jgi:hypothetical protein
MSISSRPNPTSFLGLWISIRSSILCLSFVFMIVLEGVAQSIPAATSPTPRRAIVVGFLGGFIKHDNLVHSEVQLAARLRLAYPVGVDVETFESYHEERARKRILTLLDENHDGTLTPEEKHDARIIIYGHSWGGSETIELARRLGKVGIPVLLTIQVDSISKICQNDSVIPANVQRAVNFYQPNGLLHGQPKIRAADSANTRIIGNIRFDYKTQPYECNDYPWYDRVFVKAHTQIECDANVWKRVESLIRSSLSKSRGQSD